MTNSVPQAPLDLPNLLDDVIGIATLAGELLTVFYNNHLQSSIDVQTKDDTSPVTAADMAAHDLIEAALHALTPDIPVLSEESADVSERRLWQRFWLVDPLDGTREFIRKTGEFTVNIALVEAGQVILGILGVPLKQQVYAAAHALGADQTHHNSPLRVAFRINADGSKHPLRPHPISAKHLNTAMSRRQQPPRYEAYQQQLIQAGWALSIINAGSAYKFCMMVDGNIDLYPRLHPTSEWDTAAGQCLLEVVGGAIVDLNGKPFRYNQRAELLNGSFIAVIDQALLPQVLPGAAIITLDK
jgi:3'(2'), 5'-bisphosphate nucleotidase